MEKRRTGLNAPALLCAAAIIGLGMIACARPGPGSAQTTEELLVQLQEDRSQLDQTSEVMMQRIEMFNASRELGEPTIQFSEVFAQDLDTQQRDVLDSLMAVEKDISLKGLLQQIINDRDTIRSLQEKVMHLEQTLPDKFVVVKRGDTHEGLAISFLTGEAHLDEAAAKEHLKQIDQSDELLVGNQVWFFFDPQKSIFRTYVTAGDAGQTPSAVRRARTRQLTDERDTARNERDVAQEQVASLEQDKAHLEAERVVQQNSLFYHAESDRSLAERGVLSSFLKRVRDVKGVSYDQSVNLAQETSIALEPQHYGLERIHSVKLIPSLYEEGRDYAVEIEDGVGVARLVILDPEVFKGKEILLALRG